VLCRGCIKLYCKDCDNRAHFLTTDSDHVRAKLTLESYNEPAPLPSDALPPPPPVPLYQASLGQLTQAGGDDTTHSLLVQLTQKYATESSNTEAILQKLLSDRDLDQGELKTGGGSKQNFPLTVVPKPSANSDLELDEGLSKLLENLDMLTEFGPIFAANDVRLKDLTDGVLQGELQGIVPQLGPRLRLLHAIRALKGPSKTKKIGKSSAVRRAKARKSPQKVNFHAF
jgi:hypothetical protein